MRSFGVGVGLVLLAIPARAEPPKWEGQWAFEDCPASGACTRLEVTISEADDELRAEVEVVPPRGYPQVWQEDAHARPDGGLDVKSGIVGVPGAEVLLVLTRRQKVCMQFRHLRSEHGHVEVCEVKP